METNTYLAIPDYTTAVETIVDITLFGKEHPNLRMSQREANAALQRSFSSLRKKTLPISKLPCNLLPEMSRTSTELPDSIERTRHFLYAYITRLSQGHTLMTLRDCKVINYSESEDLKLWIIKEVALEHCQKIGETLQDFSIVHPGPAGVEDILNHALLQMQRRDETYTLSPEQMTALSEAAKVFNTTFELSRQPPKVVAIRCLCQLYPDTQIQDNQLQIEYMLQEVPCGEGNISFTLPATPEVISNITPAFEPNQRVSPETFWFNYNRRIRQKLSESDATN
jgi:hypothetical protein